uniref:Uncharacterized protein n=1 Tax=Mola mola TaxID=94237 RepID=A0A3Q3X0J6_MOLML
CVKCSRVNIVMLTFVAPQQRVNDLEQRCAILEEENKDLKNEGKLLLDLIAIKYSEKIPLTKTNV